MIGNAAVVVPWVREQQLGEFLSAWGVTGPHPDWLVLQHDARKEGCAVTKNRGVLAAVERGFEVVVVLDDDCFPHDAPTLEQHAAMHVAALQPQPVEMFSAVTSPPSRGTPYGALTAEMHVAASMGFWSQVGDYCAVRQLAHDAAPMRFDKRPIFGRYFPLCGMNVAFKPKEWLPWCSFVDVPRFDDIWMGWLWQREAYRRRHCFALNGPMVRHSRQSDPWRNLVVESKHLKANETLWTEIASSSHDDYERLRALLPADAGGSDR